MEKNMTTGNSMKLILWFSLPVLIGNVFQQFYNMVDTIIVGQFLGEDALAAVGSTGSILFFIMYFAIGISQGFGVMVAQAYGSRDFKRLKHYVALSLLLTLVISVIMTALTVTTSRQILILMKTPKNILDMADAYLYIYFWGIPVVMLYNTVSSILRGIGDSKTPLYFLVFSSVLNIVLDYSFIRFLHMGTDGAALATVISQCIAAVVSIVYMFYKFEILRTSREDYYFDAKGSFELLKIGIPMALNYSITAFGTMLLQTAVNIFGSSVVAAFTAGIKVEQLATQTMPSLATTMSTYCGQNLGAKEYNRIYDGMHKAFYISLVLTGITALICTYGGKYLIQLFLSDPSDEIISYATQYLTTISVFFFFLAILYLYRTALQGLGRSFVPMLGGVLELIGRAVVLAFFLDAGGYTAVCLASPAAWVFAGILNMADYLIWKHRTKKKYAEILP